MPLVWGAVPIAENTTLTSTYGTDYTTENLTLFWDVYDGDGDPIKNITNWRLDGSPIMVLNMPFEGGSNATFTKDYSGYGNNGTVNGATWNSTGGYDGWGAYEFDGVNDGIDISDSSSLSNLSTVTVEAWIKLDAYTATGTYPNDVETIVTKYTWASGYGGFDLAIDGGKNPGFLIFNGQSYDFANASETVSLNTWYHLVGTYDGTTIKIYVNGVLKNTTNYPEGNLNSSGTNLEIGSQGNTREFNGTIDEVRIYNQVLSEEQIKALYENKTDLIVSQETSVGDVWQGCVTPNDGTSDGNESCSNSLTIQSPPVPEFSDYAILLILVMVGGGFLWIRKKEA